MLAKTTVSRYLVSDLFEHLFIIVVFLVIREVFLDDVEKCMNLAKQQITL
jgi:hypothetical protein